MKKTLLTCALASVLSVASAETITLPEAVKEQTGVYFVRPSFSNNGAQLLTNTGVFIEIFNPGERLTLDGSVRSEKFLFGGYYDSFGNYQVFAGEITGKTAGVTLSKVLGDATFETGEGLLTFDPENRGESDLIKFEFNLDNATEDSKGETLYEGTFERASDVDVVACFNGTSNVPVVCPQFNAFAHS